MYFWLKLLHISAMAVWFTGLFFLPRVLVARAREPETARHGELGRTLFFAVMTPGAVVTIALGIVLLTWGAGGAWLPAKLALVGIAVLLHVYLGQRLLEPRNHHNAVRGFIHNVLDWLPLPLLLGIAALAAAKPGALPPFGGI